jgi:hypothetical protein
MADDWVAETAADLAKCKAIALLVRLAALSERTEMLVDKFCTKSV